MASPVATGPPELSFTATNLNTLDRLPASLASIRALGEALGGSFEIIVADGPSDDGASEWLRRESAADPRLRVIATPGRNRGRGRRTAFEASVGRTIVPFDTSLAYDSGYGTILARYLSVGGPRMLFSEICALPRAAVEGAGGWRDLIGGEDVDLYARVVTKAGVIAAPTGASASQSANLGSYARQMRYVRGGRLSRWRRMYRVQRDQIVASHATVGDLMAFNRRKPFLPRVARAGFFSVCALGAKFSPIPPVRLGKNNYLVVREGLFASLLAQDWRAILPAKSPPRLPLTDDEMTFLESRSELYRANREALAPYLVRK